MHSTRVEDLGDNVETHELYFSLDSFFSNLKFDSIKHYEGRRKRLGVIRSKKYIHCLQKLNL